MCLMRNHWSCTVGVPSSSDKIKYVFDQKTYEICHVLWVSPAVVKKLSMCSIKTIQSLSCITGLPRRSDKSKNVLNKKNIRHLSCTVGLHSSSEKCEHVFDQNPYENCHIVYHTPEPHAGPTPSGKHVRRVIAHQYIPNATPYSR